MELKKKSMKVSTLASIVLSVLLAFSIGLGFTGAWFTAKANFGGINLGSITLGKIEVSATATNAQVYGSHYDSNKSKYVMDEQPAGRTIVVPGDFIKATITVTNTSTSEAYVLIYDAANTKWFTVTGTEVTVDGSLTAAECQANSGAASFTAIGSVGTEVTDQTKTLANYIEFNYHIVAVQSANISQADAWAELKTLAGLGA